MFWTPNLKWIFLWIFFSLCSPACGLEFIEHDSDAVICPQVFSGCTIKNVVGLQENRNAPLEASFKLCCKAKRDCALCLVIETEVSIPTDDEGENESHSGTDEEGSSEDMRNDRASVTACYKHAASMVLTCKKVDFTVNYKTFAHQNQNKIVMVVTDEFYFGSQIFVYPNKTLFAPSEEKVCSQELHIPMCPVPTFNIKPVYKENHVELQIVSNKTAHPSLCVKYEEDGHCERLTQTTIPLYSVAPCMCIQAWDKHDEGSLRSQICPFEKTGLPPNIQHLMRENGNLSVNVRLGKMNDGRLVLLWNLTAPCRLEGEVLLLRKASISKKFAYGSNWKQNSRGLWEKQEAFENVDERISQCVMVKINGANQELGPFCTVETGRWRWSLLVAAVLLLVCLTALMVYFVRDHVKKCVWSWRHGGFVKIGRKGHVVLLSPPDVDHAVSESVCRLGSQLRSQGFSVSVDQWCRMDQCTLGPLPWLYSQLQKLNNMGGRVLLVLNQKALEKTEEWTRLNSDGAGRDPQQIKSPYSDLFTASLFIIQTSKRLGRTTERFVLVKFDSHHKQSPSSDRRLPELLQGLPLFLLPSQSQSLTTELTVVEAEMGSGVKTWTDWRMKT